LYQLQQLLKRIHILEGFAIVFDGLDKALRIIRQSDGRKDAAERLMKVFPLDEEQTFAILDMALYKISQLEIDRIMEELAEKRAEAKRIQLILASDKKLWNVVQTELEEIGEKFGDRRRTSVGSSDEIAEFDPEAYIVRENTNVVITTDGWIKRVGKLANVETTRVREGDRVLDVVPGSTLDHVVFFSSEGIAYTMRIDQVPPSSGYGEPLSKHFRMGDGASIVAAISTDPRFTPEDKTRKNMPVPTPLLLVATARGQAMRISLSPFRIVSTKAGRKYCRLTAGDKVVGVEIISDATSIFLASHHARILHCSLDEIPILSGVGKGLRGIKLATDDALIGFAQMSRPSDCLRVRTSGDKVLAFGQMKYNETSRGGKGVKTSQRSTFEELIRPDIQLVDWTAIEEESN
ncbi:MAG: DNA gyrase C-terminal beta-propeller domain-containing protein, partial [Planctomycetaceae bacterium]